MTLPNFSVLLLAWDEADPSVAVLGGQALPPTLALVYRLAEQHPVLALFPHLPAPVAAADTPAARAANPGLETAAPAMATPAGVRLLPDRETALPQAEEQPAQARLRLIGLDELPPFSPELQAALGAPLAASRLAAPVRSQWPAGTSRAGGGQWQVPAAPYAGAASESSFSIWARVPNPAPRTTQTVREAADLAQAARVPAPAAAPRTPSAILRPVSRPQAGDLRFDPDPELPRLLREAAFSEAVAEPGAAETAAILAPEDDMTLDEPSPPAAAAQATAAQAPAPGQVAASPMLTALAPKLEGLNFRMIQYARQAAQLVRDRSDFGVIYAPNWPAWLAATEIRNHSGLPLVVYAASLAADFAAPAERGWLLEVERMALRRAHLILVPDEGVRRHLQAAYGATIGEVRVVPANDEAAVQRVLSEAAAG